MQTFGKALVSSLQNTHFFNWEVAIWSLELNNGKSYVAYTAAYIPNLLSKKVLSVVGYQFSSGINKDKLIMVT